MVIQQVGDNEEMTETNIGVGNEDPEDHLHIPEESHANSAPSVMGGKTNHGTILEVADKYPKKQNPMKLRVSIHCTSCSYRTAFLMRRTARKRLYSHHHRKHFLDFNNHKEVGHDASDVVVMKKAQADHKVNVPTHTDEEHETILDTASGMIPL